MVYSVIFSLLLTLSIELLIYGFMDKFTFKSFIAMFMANVILNVTMNVILLSLHSYQEYNIALIIAEVSTFIVESVIFFIFSKKKLWYSILAAFTANITSLSIGYLLNYYGHPQTKGAFYIGSIIMFIFVSLMLAYSIIKLFNPWFLCKQNDRNDNQTSEETKTQYNRDNNPEQNP